MPNGLVCELSSLDHMIHVFTCVPYIVSKLATSVKGDPKAPFSIATTPGCRGGCYSIPWIAPLYP